MGFEIDSVRAVNSGFRGDGVFHRKVVQITNAQIKALKATPKQLIAAPGAGWWIEVEDVVLILNYGSNVLVESTANLTLEYTSGFDIITPIEMTGFIDQAADQMAIVYAATIPTVAAAANVVNKGVQLTGIGAGEFTGNAAADTTMVAIINYQLHKSYL